MIHYRPVADFTFSPLCENQYVHFNNLSLMPAGSSPEMITKWDWQFSNGKGSSAQHPLQAFPAGIHHAQLIVESGFGCRSLLADSTFTVHPKPGITISINDSCVNIPIRYTAIDNTNLVAKWHWDLGNGLFQGPAWITKTFTAAGINSFTLIGETAHGCTDTLFRPFTIFENRSFAGNDTVAAMGQPVQLNANGGPTIQYTWSPSNGLSDPHLENPVAIYDKDQLYHLYSISDKGCVKNSDILIKRYKGPTIYIPTAFTPNNDGKNDVFFILPVGIKKFISFTIYNRHGQVVFHTEDHTKGWDGTVKNMRQASDNYVVVVRAIDYSGKAMLEKVNMVLIR
jgi:gliding motility-associated-like protein